jgi:hypothetical protein
MTDANTNDTPDTDVPVTPAQFDAFPVVANLLALIADERGCQARLAELKAQIDAAEKAMRKLAHVREGHDRAVSRDRAELAAERAAVRQETDRRMAAVEAAERGLESDKAEIAEVKRFQSARRFEPLPGGGARDWGEGGRWRDDAPRLEPDPHYDPPRPSAAAAETETVPVGAAGSTLTRSIPVPKPRRSLRKVQPDA